MDVGRFVGASLSNFRTAYLVKSMRCKGGHAFYAHHMFVLDTATLNVLGAYHDAPAIDTWNAKISGYSSWASPE